MHVAEDLFHEQDGKFNGCPVDDEAAIKEFERLRSAAQYVAIVHSAFWWLSFYAGWYDQRPDRL